MHSVIAEAALTALFDGLSWILLRAVAIDIAWSDLRRDTYEVAPPPALPPEPTQAEFLFSVQRENSAHTDSKVGQLLSLASALAAVIVVFVRDARPWWLLLTLSTSLVASVFLCITALAVRRDMLPLLEPKGRVAKREWGPDLLTCIQSNDASHRLRVDRYRAAMRYFFVALIATPLLAAGSSAPPEHFATLAAAVARMEKNGIRVRLMPSDSLTTNSVQALTEFGLPRWIARDAPNTHSTVGPRRDTAPRKP